MIGGTWVVAENNLDSLQGVLSVYEMPQGVRRADICLPGPGPHELVRAPGRDVFLVALGGLMTHPEYGRAPLNLESFRSHLVRFDLPTGKIEALDPFPGSEGVSLRHLAFDGAGRLFVGGQMPGGAGAVLWLLEGARATALPEAGYLGGNVSSVAAEGGVALVSSKVTGRVLRL